MAEKTNPRGKRPEQEGAAPEQTAIGKARAAFLNRAGKRSQGQGRPERDRQPAAVAPKREPREPVTPVPARRPDIAARSAGGGQAFVDAMTAPTKERGYRSWAELDVEEFRTLSEGRRPEAIAHIMSNARDPLYAAALREVDPELAFAYLGNLSTAGDEATRAQDPSPTDRTPAANDPRTPVDLPIDQPTLDRLAAQRARDLEVARASIAQPPAAGPAPQRPAEAPGANGIEPVVTREAAGRDSGDRDLASTPVLQKDGYDIPAAILSRYVVKEGRYWQFDGRDRTPDTTGAPHFEDRAHGSRRPAMTAGRSPT